MAVEAILKAEERTQTGSGAARRMRRDGYVPAVVYGHGESSRNLKIRERELQTLLDRISVDNTLVDLEVDGDASQKVLIREVQRHPWKARVLHVDFFQIRADEKLRVAVPLELVGVPKGVLDEGGILQQSRHDIEVECLPGEIPERFELDVSNLDIGDSLHVADLNTGGVRPLEDLDLTLCVVVPPTVIQVEEEEEEVLLEGLEPELIGREGEEEGEEETPQAAGRQREQEDEEEA
jgi:large subunit ribosomal protein L25